MSLSDLTEGIPGARLLAPGGVDGGAAAAATPISAIAYRAESAGPGACSAACPARAPTGTTSPPRPSPAARRRCWSSGPCRSRRPRSWSPTPAWGWPWPPPRWRAGPREALRVVGVTGTNGKTTTAFLLRAVLEAAGLPCGLLGTIEARVGGAVEPVARTTPESADLQRLLARMRDAGDRACAMEVSSHALAQRRVAGVRFAAALFTNLTRDHLDYHPTVEDYYRAKRALFLRPAAEGPDPPGAANVDDEMGRRLVAEAGALGFAVDAAGRRAARGASARRPDGFSARVRTPRGPVEIESALRGRFNLANVAGVVAAGELLGLDHAAVAAGIAAVPGVPGRFEPVDAGQPFQVLVDYAHTPDSLDNVLRAARDLAGDGRLLVVFGCGGDRDRGKRPQMGGDRPGRWPTWRWSPRTTPAPRTRTRDHRRDPGRRRRGAGGARGGAGPPRRHRLRRRARRPGRRGPDRRQGPRAGPGARTAWSRRSTIAGGPRGAPAGCSGEADGQRHPAASEDARLPGGRPRCRGRGGGRGLARGASPGSLFVGLRGELADGGHVRARTPCAPAPARPW